MVMMKLRVLLLLPFSSSFVVTTKIMLPPFVLAMMIAAAAMVVVPVQAGDRDRFNYYTTAPRMSGGGVDFGPSDWNQLTCIGGANVDNCLGYPDKWHIGMDWNIEVNSCLSCPADDPASDSNSSSSGSCWNHHQSPIELNRNLGIPNSTTEKECIDLHWMKYEDSTCTWQHLTDANAVTVERHALRVAQPIEGTEEESNMRLACPSLTKPRQFGRIDFSKGFHHWWFLSHIDFHVPSEHMQDGKRYSAEAQMYHYYSEPSGNITGNLTNENEMATVSFFMEAYEDAAPYEMLEKLICQWRKSEEQTREACGLDPILNTYPGCFPITRESNNLKKRRRQQEAEEFVRPRSPFQTVHDVIIHNAIQRQTNESAVPIVIEMEFENWDPAEEKDWDAFIEAESAKQQKQQQLHSSSSTPHRQDRRNLIEYSHLPWYNYFLMLGVRSEYYFRYQGTQTIPPCYGPQIEGSRTNTNHWRIMKDPIRVHPRQISEMSRLLASRIANPWDDTEFRCKPDTAAMVTEHHPIRVDVARPLQSPSERHFSVFCECKDWQSKWPEDRKWCEIQDVSKRFYETPYNFQTDGL